VNTEPSEQTEDESEGKRLRFGVCGDADSREVRRGRRSRLEADANFGHARY